jgi:hypothetical protein
MQELGSSQVGEVRVSTLAQQPRQQPRQQADHWPLLGQAHSTLSG